MGEVWAMSEPTFSSTAVFQIAVGVPVVILEESPDWSAVDGGYDNICALSRWIKVEKDGKQGWVFGSNLYKILSEPSQIQRIKNQEVRFYEKKYRPGLIQNYTYGIADSNGLTGCEDHIVFMLYTEGMKEILLFESDGKQPATSYFCSLGSSDGYSENIAAMEEGEKEIRLKVACNFQAESATYDLVLRKVDGHYSGTVENYIKVGP